MNRDEGWIFSTELRSPPFKPLSEWCKWLWSHDELQVLAFYDRGEGTDAKVLRDDQKRRTLSSVGCGLRWNLGRTMDFRFDYGWQLDRLKKDESPIDSRGHLGVTVRF